MKIGLIVDGTAEAVALRELTSRLQVSNTQLLAPLYADLQPYATPAQIARAAESRLKICRERGCARTVVLVDFELRQGCPGDWAGDVAAGFRALGYNDVSVVVKKAAFENWLISDLDSVRRRFPRRFSFRDGIVTRISGAGADNVRAISILNAATNHTYSKRKDAIEICRVLDPTKMAQCSRSFRKFLRTIGDKNYGDQSKVAA